MINTIVIEGIVTKIWLYNDDTFIRLACYRDSDMPEYKLNNTQDHADFVTVRFPKGGPVSSITASSGDHLRVHGFLQSRDYNETLAGFLKDSATSVPIPEGIDPNKVAARRSMNEVIVQRLVRLPRPIQEQTAGNGAKPAAPAAVEAPAVKETPKKGSAKKK